MHLMNFKQDKNFQSIIKITTSQRGNQFSFQSYTTQMQSHSSVQLMSNLEEMTPTEPDCILKSFLMTNKFHKPRRGMSNLCKRIIVYIIIPLFSNLNSDFSAYFGEVFTIQIVQWPESIKLQIFESKLLTSSVISEVYIPIPDVQQTAHSSTGTEQYQFTSNKISTFSHSAIGSGLFMHIIKNLILILLEI